MFAVNHYMINPIPFKMEAAAGETVTGDVVFQGESLAGYGIKDIGMLNASFVILDDNYDTISSISCDITTSLGEDATYDESGFMRAVHDDALMRRFGWDIIEGYEEKEPARYGVLEAVTTGRRFHEEGYEVCEVEFYNPSDEIVYVRLASIEVNGVNTYTNFSVEDILPGCRRVVSLYLDMIIPREEREAFFDQIESIGVYVCTYKSKNGEEYLMIPESGPEYLNIIGGKKQADVQGYKCVYDENNISVYYAGMRENNGNDWTNYLVYCPIENTENEVVQVSITNIQVNGEPCAESSNVFENVEPGTVYLSKLCIYQEDIEKMSLKSLDDIKTLSFSVAQVKYNPEVMRDEETGRREVTINLTEETVKTN